MNEPVNLYVEKNDDGEWNVYFNTPFQGRYVLDTFASKEEAVAYAQDQMDSADFSECDGGEAEVIVVE